MYFKSTKKLQINPTKIVDDFLMNGKLDKFDLYFHEIEENLPSELDVIVLVRTAFLVLS